MAFFFEKTAQMKIALIGYGKMGRTIERLALDAGHEVVLRTGSEMPVETLATALAAAEVAIEFTRPEVAFQNVSACLEAGTPVVCGTTGWLDRMTPIQQRCNEKGGAFFYASNFSIGVHLFFELNRRLAHLMNAHPQYEARLEETHHVHKLDVPSGTAVTLAGDIVDILERKRAWVRGETKDVGLLPIISHREDEVPGTHIVQYSSAIDTLSIRHEAHSREGFASGALLAAQWLIGKKGCFSMKDLLDF